ncbi:MAG: class I SAM-dependent methyltransferase [Streptosporangiaceae bacterium]
MTRSAAATAAAFIRANTALGTPPLVPEIRLYLARDAIELWERTEQQAAGPQAAGPQAAGRQAAGRPELPPPFWAFPWAGGQALARYLLDEPGRARGRAVLDLAAGSGLVGIAAAQAGAATVTASETDPFAVAAIRLNAAVNRVRLDAALGDLLGGPAPTVDLLVAGDVFYERTFAQRLLPWLARARAAGIDVLVGDPGRAYLPRDRCTEVAAYEVPVPRALEDADVKHSTVWQLR